MKGILKLAFIICLFCNLNATELLFDLTAQDYENTLNNIKAGKYKINEKIIFETNLKKSMKNNSYFIDRLDSIGKSIIHILSPINNWKLNVDFVMSYNSRDRYIKLHDINGKLILLEFNSGGFTIDTKKFKSNLSKKQLIFEIEKLDDKFIVKINGQKVYDTRKNFSNLRKIEIFNRPSDELNNQELYSYD